ncbi:glycosyltransferase family 2 protein, partial [Campylobacter lari]|nr:glycosyltransferase family 2 protein [Campylobacter lari]
VVVLDFIFDNNRIAFDIEINEKTKNVKIWMFCRNDKEYLGIFLKQALEIKENNKILIFSNIDEKLLEGINIIKSFLSKILNESKL